MSATTCQCVVPGWSGRGDFAFESPGCQTHVEAVRALWSIVAIVHFVEIFFAIRFFTSRTVKRKTTSKLPYIMTALMICYDMLFIAVGMIRAINVETRTIGTDPGLTVLFCLGATCYWAMIQIFTVLFVDIVHRQAMFFQKRKEWIIPVHRLKKVVGVMGGFSVIFSMAPLGMLACTDSICFQVLGGIHYVGLGCCILVSGVVLVPVFTKKLENAVQMGKNALIEGLNSNLLEGFAKLIGRLKFLNRTLLRQSIPQFILALLFGLWPYLQVYGSSYFLPLAWTSGACVASLILHLHMPLDGIPSTATTAMVSSDPAGMNRFQLDTNVGILRRFKSNLSLPGTVRM